MRATTAVATAATAAAAPSTPSAAMAAPESVYPPPTFAGPWRPRPLDVQGGTNEDTCWKPGEEPEAMWLVGDKQRACSYQDMLGTLTHHPAKKGVGRGGGG